MTNSFSSKKRSRLDQVLDVLAAIESGEYKPTRIMYKTTLSWNPLAAILHKLVSAGFVERRQKGNAGHCKPTYYVTAQGREFLRSYYLWVSKIKESKLISQ